MLLLLKKLNDVGIMELNMDDATKKRIEDVFRNSGSPDELFDAFDEAIRLKISDVEIYKILLGNPALSLYEIKMYAEKLLRELNEHGFQISLWTAKVLEKMQSNFEYVDNAYHYYVKAHQFNPSSFEPLLELLKLYNFDFELPTNEKIINFVEKNMAPVKIKSKIYFALSNLYKRTGDKFKEAKYAALAYKALESESNDE